MAMVSAVSTQRVYAFYFCALRPVEFFSTLWCLSIHINSFLSRIFVMPSRMRALAQSPRQEQHCVCLKYIEALVTSAVGGMDVGIALLVKSKRIIEERCIAGLCSEEKGGALTNMHFQMVVEGNFASLPVLKENQGLYRMG